MTSAKEMEYQLLVQQFRELQESFSQLNLHLNELDAIKTALGDIDKINAGERVLMPVGGGIFVRGSLLGGNVVMNAGAGVCVEKNVSEAFESIERQRAEVEGILLNTEKQMEEILGKVKELQKGLG